MYASYSPGVSSRRYRGISVAVLVHIGLAWLLISGTARKGFELLTKPLEAVVIQDVVVAPPPPPKVLVPPKAKLTPMQPPPFIPPPEVAVAPAPTAIAVVATVVAHEAPAPVQVPVVAVAAPAPVASPKVDMAIVCPTQVAPDMPRRFRRRCTSFSSPGTSPARRWCRASAAAR